MALDSTYTGLKASIADFLNRADLTAAIPDFITLAEGQMNAKLRVREMIVRNLSYSIDDEFVDCPTDFLGPVSLMIPSVGVLDCVSPDALQDLKVNAQGGNPTAYAVVGSELEFDKTPSDPIDARLVYYGKLPGVASYNTNWLLQSRPDAYLYGALLQSAPYLKDDERLSTWAELFTTILEQIQRDDARQAFGARLTPIPSQVA